MKKRDDLTNYVVTTFDSDDIYSKIMSEVNKKDYLESVLNIINPVMDSYKKDSKLFIRDFMDFLIELIGDLDVDYESMTDEEYHEYTVAFPADDTEGQDFYIYKTVERERVEMFISQRRIRSLEEMLMDTGFHEEWVDMIVDKGTSLKK